MTMVAPEVTLESLRLDIDADGIAVVTLDLVGEKMNLLSEALMREMDVLLGRLDSARAVIFISGKPEGFIAGADIKMLARVRTAEEGEALSRAGQDILNRIEQLPIPTVCAIHGATMGGGLEFALACRYRIVTSDPSTQLSLPEVQLGLIPGAGGTQRLPRLVGMEAALNMILNASKIRAEKARKMGLVHEVVPKELLLDRARRAARQLARATADLGHIPIKPTSAKRPAGSLGSLMLEATVPGRVMMYRTVKKTLQKKVGNHYPAPYMALAAVYHTRGHSFEEGLRLEAELFGKLTVTDVAKNLQSIYFASTEMKKEPFCGADGKPAKAHDVKKVAVLGGGLMGGGIATISADKGYRVRVKDRDLDGASKAAAYADRYFSEKVKKRHIRPYQKDMALGLLSVTDQYTGFKNVDIVIEAVFEDMNLKHRVLAEVEAVTRPDCVFASNTSALPISRIAEGSKHPETVLGMHYFSPVEKMPLLEVITTDKTAPWAVATALAVGRKQGKTCIVVGDGPGFYTTRALAAMMNETIRVFLEGASVEAIDKAMTDFGFPVGPMALIDEVGFDVAKKVLLTMIDAFGNRFQVPDEAIMLLDSGRLGRKNGKGFYAYGSGKKKEVDPTVYDSMPYGRSRIDPSARVIQDRLVFAFMNEAAMILEEGVLRSARDGDIGAIFGLGFPPFLGGPFRYIDHLGLPHVVSRLRDLKQSFSRAFEPARILVTMAEEGKTFHGGQT